MNITHQGDEVGERHLDVDRSDVPALLRGPNVLVVAPHQILDKFSFEVDGRCCRETTQTGGVRDLKWNSISTVVFIKRKIILMTSQIYLGIDVR